MLSCMWIRSCIWIAGLICLSSSVPRIDSTLELLDELHDREIYVAVVNSMNEWQRRQNLKKSTNNRIKREESTVCYEELGCFDASGPFGYLDMLPSKPEDINTRFLMYPARTRQRRSGSIPAEIPFEKLDEAFTWAKSGFNKSLPTKVLIHGFGSDCGYIWAYEIRSALMAVEEINTICVDWSNGATLPNYVKASANTRLVGKQLSLLLRGLVENNGLSLVNTHLIGFSLGAHIAGFAGADLGNLSRITGLDPAGPLFESQDTRARLDETDAAFVDVIHSNGENLILGGLGSSQPMGHVDFYPNGGRMQKGCSHLFVGAVSDIIWSSAVEGRSLCNHRRAYKFFIDSVSPRCHFPAFPCDSYDNFLAGKCFPCTDERKCGNMGYYADRSKGRGQLFLITREEEPFCAHQYLVGIETTPGPIQVKSYGKIHVTFIGDSFLNETFMMTRKEDEEMKLGQSISKIVVLHPILSQPTKIEILYTAYSGWLSSGLTQWKIDKVMLMDSFGKISSICKKSQILESGIPLILPLYPRDCDVLKGDSEEAEVEKNEETVLEQAENAHPGYVSNKDEKLNLLDIEAESSRAFNSRVIKADKLKNEDEADSDGLIREIVEPILKTHSTKNGRSHTPDKHKPEITEPILGPTTVRSGKTSSAEQPKEALDDNETNNGQDSQYWRTKEHSGEKWKRQDESKALKGFDSVNRPQSQTTHNPLDAIVTTVQFLPQRLARMFEQAEKYARETILPLVSTYTPRFLTDFIGPREEPKYVPLQYEEDEIQQTSSSEKFKTTSNQQSRSISDKTIVQPVRNSVSSIPQIQKTEDGTTPYSHIQRITKKKSEKSGSFSSTNLSSDESTTTTESGDSVITPPTFNDTNSSILVDKTKPSFSIKIDYGTPAEKKKRQNDDEKVPYTVDSSNNANMTLIKTLANTIQSLPDNFVKVLNQVQSYTRNNILPFVQSYSPRRLSDLLWIRPRPNSTITIDRKSMNTSSMQGKNVSLTWSIFRDFNTTAKPKSDVVKTSTIRTTTTTTTTTGPSIVTTAKYLSTTKSVPTTTSTSTVKSLFTVPLSTTARFVPIVTSVTTNKNLEFPMSSTTTTTTTAKSLTTELSSTTTSKDVLNSTELNRKLSLTDILTNKIQEEKTITISKSDIDNEIPTKEEFKNYNHIQRIPKKGQKTQYKIPHPFTIVINPDDLTTSTPTTTTTTTTTIKPPQKFESYIQKIPRKMASEKPPRYKIIRSHPWDKNSKIGDRVITSKNHHGAQVSYRITSDGRYVV